MVFYAQCKWPRSNMCKCAHPRSTTGRTRKGVRVQSWAPRWGAATLQHHSALTFFLEYRAQWQGPWAYLCWRRWKYVADQFLNQPLRGKILWNTWRCKVASFCHTWCLFSISGVQFLLLVSWWNAFHLESPYAFYLAHPLCVSGVQKSLCLSVYVCVCVSPEDSGLHKYFALLLHIKVRVSVYLCCVSNLHTLETLQSCWNYATLGVRYISAVFPSICSIFLCLCKSIYICLCKRFLASEISIEEE